MDDKQLEDQVKLYADLARENKNIDVAGLMVSALSRESNVVSPRARKWAYLVSVGLPPLGLLFAAKYYLFSEEADAKQVANWCVILTVIAIIGAWIILQAVLSGSGANLQQIEQIKPQDIQNALQ